MFVRLLTVLAVAILVSGCVTSEVARFRPQAGQDAIYRDGNPAIVSRKPGSIVIIQPASRQFQVGTRPVYVLGMHNLGVAPFNFTMNGVSAFQLRQGQIERDLKVYTYEQLVAEENAKRFARSLLVAVAAGLNSASTANAGHYRSQATVYGPRGVRQVSISGYDPAAASIARANATAQNEVMIANAIETGRRNLAMLEQGVLKDNTLMPGEWYGGQLHFDAPIGEGERSFRIRVQVGPDTHDIDVVHEQVT